MLHGTLPALFHPPQDKVFSLCLVNCGSFVLACVINSPEDLNVVHAWRGVGSFQRVASRLSLTHTRSCLTRAEESFKCDYVFVSPRPICVRLSVFVSCFGGRGLKFVCKQQSWSLALSH